VTKDQIRIRELKWNKNEAEFHLMKALQGIENKVLKALIGNIFERLQKINIDYYER
jgi:hypothetical protein